MFNDIIEAYMVAHPRPKWTRTNNRRWPSEASCSLGDGTIVGKCLREQYYDIKGYPPDKTILPRIYRIWAVGKAIEQSEIQRAKDAGIWVADDVGFQMEIRGGVIVSGKLDAIYRDTNGNHVCVEYKTSSGYMFEKEVYGKYSRVRSNPKPEHILQVMIYLEAMKHLPYGIVYYINRDKMDVIEHRVELSHGVAIINGAESEFNIESVYDRYILMTGYLNDEVLPPCDYCPQYPIDDIDDIYRRGGMYKSAYNAWLSDGIRPCDGRCRYLCSYYDTCVGTTSDEVQIDDSGHGAIVVL